MLYDFTADWSNFYIVMEVLQGGELMDRITKKGGDYSEGEARGVIQCVLRAVDHMHRERLVHRDIKPANLFLASPHDDSEVKLGDLGFAAVCAAPLTQPCGTPQ